MIRMILTLALIAWGLAWGPVVAGAQDVYKIGAVFSITGPGSSLGIPERDTALMIEADVNAKGGIKGPDGKLHPLKIVIYDDASDETKARYGFVFGDFKRVHRTALIACVYRAAEWRHKAIELAAHRLLQHLDKTTG